MREFMRKHRRDILPGTIRIDEVARNLDPRRIRARVGIAAGANLEAGTTRGRAVDRSGEALTRPLDRERRLAIAHRGIEQVGGAFAVRHGCRTGGINLPGLNAIDRQNRIAGQQIGSRRGTTWRDRENDRSIAKREQPAGVIAIIATELGQRLQGHTCDPAPIPAQPDGCDLLAAANLGHRDILREQRPQNRCTIESVGRRGRQREKGAGRHRRPKQAPLKLSVNIFWHSQIVCAPSWSGNKTDYFSDPAVCMQPMMKSRVGWFGVALHNCV